MNTLLTNIPNLLEGSTAADGEIVFDGDQNSANSVCVLARKGFFSVEGTDAEKFLQGQLTCDVAELSPNNSSLGAHCTAKGRAIASFRLAKPTADKFIFALPANNLDALTKSLGKYIVFSKAEVAPTDLIAIGLSGSASHAFVSKTFGELNDNANMATNTAGIAIRIATDRYELWLNEAQLIAAWPDISQIFTASTPFAWYQADIDAKLVDIEAATSDQFVPQMFNLDANGGISFTKGCYTGQEIVARLKYLGKQKRHLVRFNYEGTALAVGTEITNANDKSLGTIVSATLTSGLAVVNDAAFDESLTATGTAINLLDGK